MPLGSASRSSSSQSGTNAGGVIPRLRWGIMGAAGINRQFVPGLRRAGQIVQAIASRRPAAAQQLAQELGLAPEAGRGAEPGLKPGTRRPAHAAVDAPVGPAPSRISFYEGEDAYTQLLNDSAVDVIYVPLANHLHRPAVLAALAAGKPVLCEKPLGRNAHEAGEMVTASRQAKVRLAEAFMYRYLPAHRFAAGLRAALGRVLLVRATFAGRYDPHRANYRSVAALGGGALLDVGCYAVHTARSWLASPNQPAAGVPTPGRSQAGLSPDLQVAAAVGHFAPPPGRIDLTVTALLVGPTGSALVDCSFETDGSQQRCEVVGEQGRFEIPVAYNPHGAVTEIRLHGESLQTAARSLAAEWQRAGASGLRAGEILGVDQAAADLLVVRFAPVDPFAREAASFALAVQADRQQHGAVGSAPPDDPLGLPAPLPPADAWANAQVLDAILQLAREHPVQN